jgi:hypothetical protein
MRQSFEFRLGYKLWTIVNGNSIAVSIQANFDDAGLLYHRLVDDLQAGVIVLVFESFFIV